MKTTKNKEVSVQEKEEEPKSERTENLVAIGVFIFIILIGLAIFTKGFGLFEKAGNETARIRIPLGNDPYIGSENSKILIIAFSEYECPFCTESESTMKSIREKYAAEVVYVFKDYPLTRIHPNAYNAALAAECAKEQDKYWEYHDLLYEHNDQLEPHYLEEYAGLVGLDTEKFKACFETQKYKLEVEKDILTGKQVGVSGTPTFFINGIMVVGAKAEEEFIKIINSELDANK
ncbi:hypothetical protein AYK26_02285 [Euryarchaeota archaeon SM23-78]|nr:MAG: hypothetical protein AYK26_02285 [Euryarchaeota archaeon SM23-78]MBW3001248.1 DsbA family protein [Candidatus Woesearchaeota archaeon]